MAQPPDNDDLIHQLEDARAELVRMRSANAAGIDFELLVRNAADAVLVVDAEVGAIAYANETASAVLGYSAEKLVGRPFAELFPERDPDLPPDPENLRTFGGVFEGQEFVRADGSICVVDLTAILTLQLRPDGRSRHILVMSLRDSSERMAAAAERERLIGELQDALAEVKRLSGLLPICAVCKKIRDDGGYWSEVELYIRARTDAEFSHGLCPECAREFEKQIDEQV